MLTGRITLALSIFLLPVIAAAEAQFTAEDIIKHFANQNAAAAVEPENSGVVVNGRTTEVKKPSFRGVTGAGSAAKVKQTVLSDGLVIPLTGAGRKTASAAESAVSATTVSTQTLAEQRESRQVDSGYDLLVTFELSSDQLTPQAQTNLRQFAIALQTPALAGFNFAVEGHTDATGSADKNLKLSERRAASVVGFLTSLGVQSKRLSATGYGESKPLLADPTDPGNRRVETRRVK